MANQLLELLKREQTKLARNVFELAGYYAPMGRLPDLIDYTMMQKRLELLGEGQMSVKELWPQASEAFGQKLQQRVEYSVGQMEAVKALAGTIEGEGLSMQEQFDVGYRNSRMFQQQSGDTGQ